MTAPKTDRYQVPAHLEGLVFLVKDDSPFLPTGSQLKKAGDADRDNAVKNLSAGPARKVQRIAEAIQVEEGRDRSHLKPNSGGTSIEQSRSDMMGVMGKFVDVAMLKAQTDERKVSGEERAKKRAELKDLMEMRKLATSAEESTMYDELIKAATQELTALIKIDAANATAAAANAAAASSAAQLTATAAAAAAASAAAAAAGSVTPVSTAFVTPGSTPARPIAPASSPTGSAPSPPQHVASSSATPSVSPGTGQ